MNNIEKVGNSEWLNMDDIEKADSSERLNMNNTEKVDNPEWLDDEKARNAIFRQLGLSEDQKYSELSEEEKQLLNMAQRERNFVLDSYYAFRSHHNAPLEDERSAKRSYINKFIKTYNGLSGAFIAPDGRSSEYLTLSLTDSLLGLDVPFEKIQKINHLMLQPDIPNFAKQMATFRVLYPDLKTSFKRGLGEWGIRTAYNQGEFMISSPVLDSTNRYGAVVGEDGYLHKAEDIIYRDILKCAFGSGGNNVKQFLDKLNDGTSMMNAIMSWPDSEEHIDRYYSEEDLKDLRTLILQLHSIHYQTDVGQTEEYDKSINNSYKNFGKESISNVKKIVQKIFEEFRPTKRYDLADRVVRSFCYPLGIRKLSDAYEYLDQMQTSSFARHQDLVEDGEVGQVSYGDFVKAVGSSEDLAYLFENGVLAKEYLGVGARSDCTPLDTDVAMITDDTQGLEYAIRQSCAATFSGLGDIHYGRPDAENIFLIFRNDDRFSVDKHLFDDRDDDDYVKGDDGFYYDADSYYNFCCDEDGREYDDDKRKSPYRYYGERTYKKDKYEVFPPVDHYVTKEKGDRLRGIEPVFYEDDYGVRTGIPSSEIDYIATDERSANKIIKAIKESGLYIPVTDLDGYLIYNPFESQS